MCELGNNNHDAQRAQLCRSHFRCYKLDSDLIIGCCSATLCMTIIPKVQSVRVLYWASLRYLLSRAHECVLHIGQNKYCRYAQPYTCYDCYGYSADRNKEAKGPIPILRNLQGAQGGIQSSVSFFLTKRGIACSTYSQLHVRIEYLVRAYEQRIRAHTGIRQWCKFANKNIEHALLTALQGSQAFIRAQAANVFAARS